MCLKYSIFWHLAPLVKIILPVVVIVSVLAKDIPGSIRPRALRPATVSPGVRQALSR
jgi:hypothetical protein